MAKIKCYPFCDDLLVKSIENIEDKSILIYPTRSSATMARKLFQERWQLERVDFITMDELKKRLLIGPLPLLEEEKRLLCLYSVLSEEDREHFHINEYSDVISWGAKWFAFFEELAEEQVNPQTLLEASSIPSFYLQIWQEEYIDRILALRERYRQYIQAKGFDDRIFVYGSVPPQFAPAITGYTFVNQYYYSALERSLIETMEKEGFEVTIIFQGEEKQLDRSKLSLKPLSLRSVFESGALNTRKIQIIESGSEEQMIIGLLRRLDDFLSADKSCALIDRLFFHKAYSNLFDPQKFGLKYNPEICSSPVYRMLSLICHHLREINTEDGRGYLPLRLLRDALTEQWFTSYFDLSEQALEEVRNELCALINQDFLYLDTDLQLFLLIRNPEHYQSLVGFLKSYFPILKAFGRINCIQDLMSLFDGNPGLDIGKLAGEITILYSDFLDKFWERNNNFFAIESLGVVQDWQQIFGREPGSIATSILELYLQFLKPVRISYQSRSQNDSICKISDLMDSRNLRYQSLIINNVIEGEIPQSPSPTWLLNETQRRCLSLKTWEDIREWDRYYFYRLIFGSETALLFCYKNAETNQEPGSFIGELALAYQEFGATFELETITEKHSISPLIRGQINTSARAAHFDQAQIGSLSALKDPKICGLDREDPAEFFCLPAELDRDFGESQALKTGYYGLSAFLENAFSWYIVEHKKISKLEIEKTESISRKVFGTILHNFISSVLTDYQSKHQDRFVKDTQIISTEYLGQKLFDLLKDPVYSYKIPKNYNRDFLLGIMADCLVAAIEWVFNAVLYSIPELSSSTTKLIPEKDYSTAEERLHKQLVPAEDNEARLSLWIKGRADLRIESADVRYIIDFKTGSMNTDQLSFYEWFYYLLDQEELPPIEIKSMFCHLLDRKVEAAKNPEESRIKLYGRICEQLDLIASQGYRIASRSTGRQRLKEISRADLFKSRMWGNNE